MKKRTESRLGQLRNSHSTTGLLNRTKAQISVAVLSVPELDFPKHTDSKLGSTRPCHLNILDVKLVRKIYGYMGHYPSDIYDTIANLAAKLKEFICLPLQLNLMGIYLCTDILSYAKTVLFSCTSYRILSNLSYMQLSSKVNGTFCSYNAPSRCNTRTIIPDGL